MAKKSNLPSAENDRVYDGWYENPQNFVEDLLEHHLGCKIPKFHEEMYGLIRWDDRLLITAPRGFAKAQSLDSKILTPDGFKQLSDLKLFDNVIGSDGKPTKIIQLHPVSKMELYRVTTRDGRSTLCNLDHLWTVQTPSNTGDRFVTKSTRELLNNYKAERFDKRDGKHTIEYRHFLQPPKAIEFDKKEFIVDSYTLGAWLGDGTTSSGGFTTEDEEVVSYFPYKVSKRKSKYGYGILKLQNDLIELGVLNNKHIPDEYLFGSINQRVALLQGLMDTDGTIVKGGRNFSFTNKNKRIIDGTVSLIHSLGGTATIGDNFTRFDNNSELRHSYRISARLPKEINPFRLKRKADKWVGSIKVKSAIVDIRYEYIDYGRCITVENKDGLYVTDGYMLTHNSYICSVFYVLWSICFKEFKKILIISASEAKAIDFLRTTKMELENNKLLISYFGKLKSKKWSDGHIITRTGIEVQAKGAAGQILGYRPNLIVLDDIEDEDSSASKEQLEKKRKFIFKSCYNSLAKTGRNQIIWIGTILNHLCLINEYLENEQFHWVKRRYMAYVDGVEETGHELWAELWDHKALQERKAEIGSYFFSTEFMNDPTGNERAPINAGQIKYWDVEPNELPPNLPAVIVMDPAYSEDEKADPKGIALISIDSRNNRYMEQLILTHVPQAEYRQLAFNLWMANKNRVTGFGVPNEGVEKGFFDGTAKELTRLNLPIPITPVANKFTNATGIHRNKAKRTIAALQPLFERGMYYISKEHDEAKIQIVQIGTARHDEVTDLMTYAEQILEPNYEVVQDEVEEVDRYGQVVNDFEEFENWGYDY